MNGKTYAQKKTPDTCLERLLSIYCDQHHMNAGVSSVRTVKEKKNTRLRGKIRSVLWQEEVFDNAQSWLSIKIGYIFQKDRLKMGVSLAPTFYLRPWDQLYLKILIENDFWCCDTLHDASRSYSHPRQMIMTLSFLLASFHPFVSLVVMNTTVFAKVACG